MSQSNLQYAHSAQNSAPNGTQTGTAATSASANDATASLNIPNGLFIPPQPRVLIDLKREQAMPVPDVKRVAACIGQDPGLAAAMLKTLSSPAYGVRASSITHAINMLGLPRIFSIVNGLALRAQLQGKVKLDRFWDTCADTAAACTVVAKHVPGLSPDECMLLGLFHECGVAVLALRFPEYKETLRIANETLNRRFTDIEEERHGTNHAVVGHLVAKHWALPEDIREVILLHHEKVSDVLKNPGITQHQKTLMCVLKIGEYISHSARRATMLHDWEVNRDLCLDHLGLTKQDFNDLVHDFEATSLLEEDY